MQTFLPYPGFRDTARVLDRRRLGKQRVEALQILNALERTTGGWRNHPAVKMWRGYELALASYTFDICDEWTERFGFRDTVAGQVLASCGGQRPLAPELPWWLGEERLHRSHQSNLIRKDPAYYGPLFPGVPPDLPYWWPVE